jgi:hypothetical protein
MGKQERYYSEKDRHLLRGIASRNRIVIESRYPDAPFIRPAVDQFVTRRFMMRDQNSGKSKKS